MRHSSRHGVLALVCALLVVACSSSGDSTTESSQAADPQQTLPLGAEAEENPPPDTSDAGDSAPETDSGDDTVGEPDGAPTRYSSASSDVLFDPDVVHTFAIDLDADKLAEIDADPTAEEYVEGSLTFDGETIGPIGVRYKGSVGAFVFCTDGPNPLEPSGKKSCTKLSMKLKINWEDSDTTFYGVKKVQLHSQNIDPTKMRERLGYWLFRSMGVPVPRSTHARVEINGEYIGLFALTEQIDGRFTRENFDDGSGNLYKEVWPFDGDGQPRDPDALIAGLKTNEDEDPTTELISGFADALANAEPGTEVEVVREWMDVDLLVRTLMVDRAIRNDDGPLHWYCFDECDPHNFYFYENPTSGKLTLVPWDLDNAFESLDADSPFAAFLDIPDQFGEISNDCEVFIHGPFQVPQKSAACDPLIAAISQLTAEFDAARAEFVAGPFAKESVDEQIATWSAQIEDFVAEAEQAHADAQPEEAWREAMADLIADIDVVRATDGR